MDVKHIHRYQLISLMLLVGLSVPVNAQWDFVLKNFGNPQSTLPMDFPMAYAESTCQFETTVFDQGQWVSAVVENNFGCNQPHILILDGYRYSLPVGFTLTMTDTNHLYLGAISLGTCRTRSGNPITSGTPSLTLDGLSIQFRSDRKQNVFYLDGATHFQYHSVDGDIVCTEGTPQANVYNAIFMEDFE